jgi:hypothetical protein
MSGSRVVTSRQPQSRPQSRPRRTRTHSGRPSGRPLPGRVLSCGSPGASPTHPGRGGPCPAGVPGPGLDGSGNRLLVRPSLPRTNHSFRRGLRHGGPHRRPPDPALRYPASGREPDNGRAATLTINDRGPFVEARILDVSRRIARELDMLGPGTARVRITVLEAPPPSRCWMVQIGAYEREERPGGSGTVSSRRVCEPGSRPPETGCSASSWDPSPQRRRPGG